MMKFSVEMLVRAGILILESPDDNDLKRDGYVSYVVQTGYVLVAKSQCDDSVCMVTYVQECVCDSADGSDGASLWVVQLSGFRDTPNNHGLNAEWEFGIYSECSPISQLTPSPL